VNELKDRGIEDIFIAVVASYLRDPAHYPAVAQ
jgi:hypothetical protein